jgi:DNA primase
MSNSRLVDDIKSKLDIVDLISGYVQLKKSGQNWKGLCPFHSEKTPSFTVSQSKQIFHCFGCGSGGDIIAFLSKYENLSFGETLEMLAKKTGVPLPKTYDDKKFIEKNEKIRNAMAAAGDYFRESLQSTAGASAYLEERGIVKEFVDRFRIGYAPPGWSNLIKHLRSRGFADSVIREAGLAATGTKGLYDMFRHRIIFPITSSSGGIVAFGGRALDDSSPKYINSPETPVFKKSETLFGLHPAKEEIRNRKSVLIVEGYLDVIVCHQYGFGNTVAPLGTALTTGHLQKLRSLTDRAVLIFDGDSAGKAAAKRSLPLVCQGKFITRVLILPDSEDPDSFLRKHGADAFNRLIGNAKTAVDFLFSIAVGEKTETVREALTLLAGIEDLLLADEMLAELSERAKMNEAMIREEYRKIKRKFKTGRMSAGPGQPAKRYNNEEYLLLSSVLAFPEKTGHVLSLLNMGDIKDETVRSLFSKLAALDGLRDSSSLLGGAGEKERAMIAQLCVNPGFDPEQVDRNIRDCCRRIKQRKLDEQLLLAERSEDLELINSLLAEKKKFLEDTT